MPTQHECFTNSSKSSSGSLSGIRSLGIILFANTFLQKVGSVKLDQVDEFKNPLDFPKKKGPKLGNKFCENSKMVQKDSKSECVFRIVLLTKKKD